MQNNGLIRLMSDELQRQQRESKRDKLANHPSSLGYCTRRLVYEKLGYAPLPKDSNTLFIFELGHAIHDSTQKLLLAAGLIANRADVEIAVKDEELNILGHADGILTLKSGKYLLEIKSINQKGFIRLKSPKDEHVVQAQIYMHLLGLDKSVILYICKDYDTDNYSEQDSHSLPMKEFVVDYDPETIKHILNKIATINQCVAEGKLPPREHNVTVGFADFACRYCDFVEHCQSAYPAWQAKEQRKKAAMSDSGVKGAFKSASGIGAITRRTSGH